MDYNFHVATSKTISRSKMVSRLEGALTLSQLQLLRLIAGSADGLKFPLYLVGGVVRDLLLGLPSQDFDLVVEGQAIALAKVLVEKYGGRITVHARFGTAKWDLRHAQIPHLLPSEMPVSLDLITARSETYAHSGALPTVRPGTLVEDLHRRDFTINTLAVRLDGDHFGELRNDLGGYQDLQTGRVRSLHPRSYLDDPTRILRAVRYEQRYGFRITRPDLEQIAASRPLLAGLSADRIRHELNLILIEDRAAGILERLADLGGLKSIHPGLPWNKELHRRIAEGLAAPAPDGWGHIPLIRGLPGRAALGYLLWFIHLDSLRIRSLDARLHFPAPLRDAALVTADLFQSFPSLSSCGPVDVYERLTGVPALVILAAYLALGPKGGNVLNDYMTRLRHLKPKTGGNDLIRLGLKPGPEFQVILKGLRDAWLEGRIHSSAGEADLLTKYLQDLPG